MLTESKCEKIIDEALDLAERASSKKRPIELEVTVHSNQESTSRFAGNEMTQNQSAEMDSLSMRLLVAGRQVKVTGERLDKTGLANLLDQGLTCAARLEEDPELWPPAKLNSKRYPGKLPRFRRFDEATAAMSAEKRAELVRSAVEVASRRGVSLAGIVSSGDEVTAIGNSRGLRQFCRQSSLEISLTASAGDSTGWAKAFSTKADIDVSALAERAISKALAGRMPQDIEPGRYLTILEPSAVLDLLAFLWWDFAATSHIDNLSSLKDKLGTKVFSEKLTIVDDCSHPLQHGLPFDGEGLPRQSVQLVEEGVFKNIVTGRRSADKLQLPQTNHCLPQPDSMGEMPLNIVVKGGETSLDDMIASVGADQEAILLTRVWYVREVDPATKLLTGMTRDGTFLVRDGKIARPIKNLRFNVSLFDLLNNIVALGESVGAAGEEGIPAVVPPMLVKDFNFTEVTKF